MKNNIGKDCIYMYNLTRRPIVSFVGKVHYFGGSLIMLKPKNKYNLNNIASYLNSDTFKNNLSDYFPFLIPTLNNFYEIIFDISSFIKDLIK